MTIRIGIIGIGYGQHVLLPAFNADSRAEVTALCASTVERAKAVADKHGVADAYDDPFALIASPDVDAVAIAVPPDQQPAIALAVLNAGKPVFVEKPLATRTHDARELAELAAKTGNPNVIDFEFPEIDAWQIAQRMLADDAVGTVHHIEVTWDVQTYANRNLLTNWKTQSEMGGTLYNFTSHVFHYLEWFSGQPITHLSARLGKGTFDTRSGDTLNLIAAQLANGTLANVTVSSNSIMGSGHRIAFYGQEGTLILENTSRDYIYGFTLKYARAGDEGFSAVELPREDRDVDGRRFATGRLITRFLDWIADGQPTTPTIREGLRVQTLIASAQESNEQGAWVAVANDS